MTLDSQHRTSNFTKLMIKLLRIMLFPVSALYGVVMAVRNVMFSKGILKAENFSIPVISIGNVTVGGTGKTPHTEFVIRLLKEKYNVAVLSRGYGRKTKGFWEVETDSLPEQCGDEPCQMKEKFPEQSVYVDEDRREGIFNIIQKKNVDVVLLDDAYQHRWVKPGLSILLVDYNRPIFSDFIMPTGNLREFSCGSKRADIIIITKCAKDVSDSEKTAFTQKLKLKSHQELYFSTFAYGALKGVLGSEAKIDIWGMDVLLVTGIANPQPLELYLNQQGANIISLSFPDHYQFNDDDIKKIESYFERLSGEKRCIITTEKDAVRLASGVAIPEKVKNHLFYIPIEVEILDNDECLRQKIESYVKENSRSC